MHGGYLATESSRDTSCCVGSLNNSGITVKECAGQSGFKSQSTPSKVVDGDLIRVSFDTWQRSPFPYSSAQRTQKEKRRPLLAGKIAARSRLQNTGLLNMPFSKYQIFSVIVRQ